LVKGWALRVTVFAQGEFRIGTFVLVVAIQAGCAGLCVEAILTFAQRTHALTHSDLREIRVAEQSILTLQEFAGLTDVAIALARIRVVAELVASAGGSATCEGTGLADTAARVGLFGTVATVTFTFPRAGVVVKNLGPKERTTRRGFKVSESAILGLSLVDARSSERRVVTDCALLECVRHFGANIDVPGESWSVVKAAF